MGRVARDRNENHPKPVQKIELSEKHIGLRFALVVVLIIVAVVSFGYGISQLLSEDSGWTEIEVDSAADTNIGNEFVLMYNLGSRSDLSITAEKKEVIALYTEVMEQAFQLFHNNQNFEHVYNVYYINQHPNEEIFVDDMLYQAFETVRKYENRLIYLAPIFEQYGNLFLCEDDSQAVEFDPLKNEQLAASFKEIASFANDNEAINLELLGDNKIILKVSDEYLQYCEENGVNSFIDFSWMTNAFVVDYLAEKMTANGFTAATISSYDGYSINLDESDISFSFNIYDYNQGNVVQTAAAQYSGAKSIVSMRAFPINSLDMYHYYEYSNGEIRTSYLDTEDGLCKSATSSMYAYAEDFGCSEILLQMAPVYISQKLEMESITPLKENEIFFIIISDAVIHYNEENLILTDLYESYTTNYVE